MFWGITLEHGKIYSQIVEQSFHISMAALGYENLTSDATTIMVESGKADYAVCTLQSGKIPQQTLDLNFTEGEDVKFFLEGNGGVVHITGYLLETPREYEFDEEDLEDMLSSEEEASSADSDQEENEAKNTESSAEDSSAEIKVTEDIKIEPEERLKKAAEDDDDDLEISWQNVLTGDLDESEGTSESDGDWNPSSKKLKDASELKSKARKTVGKRKQPISQTLVDLMDIENDSEASSDEDWAPKSDNQNGTSMHSIDTISLKIEDRDRCSYNGDISS